MTMVFAGMTGVVAPTGPRCWNATAPAPGSAGFSIALAGARAAGAAGIGRGATIARGGGAPRGGPPPPHRAALAAAEVAVRHVELVRPHLLVRARVLPAVALHLLAL